MEPQKTLRCEQYEVLLHERVNWADLGTKI
jgi:hypothetical protein